MDTITLLYVSFGGMILFAFGMVLMIISGKSILFDFYRRIVPRGCDVFIINSNRQMAHYYRVPQDNKFTIGGKTYITNPDKIASLSDDMKEEVSKSLKLKTKRLEKRINDFEKKKNKALEDLKKLSDVPANRGQIEQYKAFIISMDSKIIEIKKRLTSKEQLYYNKKRGAFFYIDGDPVPKDFHEYYTQMDSITIDNVIARGMTKDPKAVHDLEKQIKFIKFMLYVTVIIAGVSVVLLITLKTDVGTIAQTVGATLTV